MRFFLATTDELRATHELVSALVSSWNETHEPAERFEVVDWSAHVAAETGDERTPLVRIEAGDVFLGIAWLRFSAPVADTEAESAGDLVASTEEDFELAYRSWATAPRASAFFYRSTQPPRSLAEIRGDELARVERFYARFTDGKGPGHYGEYQSAAELEGLLLRDLEAALVTYRSSAPQRPAAAEVTAATRGENLPAYAKKMQPGKAYEVSFLAIEMVRFAELAQGQDQEGVEILHRSFRQMALDTAAAYGGELFTWDAERGLGLLMFWSKRSHDHAIITGLKVLHGLPVFNLDPRQNPVGTSLEVKAGAHDAVIVFQMPVTEISSPDLDFLLELRETGTQAGELAVSKRLLDRADPRLRARFHAKERFQGEPIFACRLPSTEQHALRANLEDVIRRVRSEAAGIKALLVQPTESLEPQAVDVLSRSVEETYAHLDRACQLLARLDRSWSKKFFAELTGFVHVLVREETELWTVLRRGHVQHRASAAIAGRLENVVKAASSLRSRPAVTLAQAEQNLGGRAADETAAAAPPADDQLKKKVALLLRSDPLDQETVLTDLLLHEKTRLLDYLSEPHPGDKTAAALVNKLWESADLVLLDDLYSIRGHQRAHEKKFYDVLTQPPVQDGRFRVVQQLLQEDFRPAENLVSQRFEQAGLEAENRDFQVVWRAVVLGHPTIRTRTIAALKMSQFSMWQAIAHPSVPIPSIHAIGERIAKSESDDAKKIFFDCIRSRILAAVEGFRTRDELSAITKLILLLLDFPFLVETGYFERFDTVLGQFLERSHKLGLEVEYFENLRQRLESAKRDPDAKAASRPPAGITKLPLTIQRRLAGEPHYVHWFVTHPDARIAGETLRNITLSNVERVLRSPEVNGAVMAQLLKKPELFTRSGPLLAALNNPKCDLSFAQRYLANLGRSRGGLQALEKLSRNPSANAAVRTAAGRIVAQAGQATAR